MQLKKLSQLFAGFLLLFILNMYLSVNMYVYTKKNTKIMVILDEFSTVQAATMPNSPSVLGESSDVKKDPRVAVLKEFFRRHESPLYEHAEFIVATADKYGLDFRLIPAISMQESNACKVIPHNSYNCYGWGIYGNNVLRFNSYEEGIEVVSKGLKTHYIDKGYVTPDEIMRKYNPTSAANGGSWAYGVNTFFKALEL